MGEVYEADDQALGARVALKLLRTELAADAAAEERLKREIQLAREVTHRNVCRIFDLVHYRILDEAGFERTTLGLTMELLRGETLAERLARDGPIATAAALPLARQMAAALHAAHLAGVVHRDFKSSNVMLVPTADGDRVVVTDFGVALPAPERREGTKPLTGEDAVVGTAEYMAPEQARGEEITAASDIYAFGVVLFEMVTGQRPHTGATPMATLMERARVGPRSPRTLVGDIDPLWDRVITRCLAREPADRFASAAEVVAALTDSSVSQFFELEEGLALGGTTGFDAVRVAPRSRWWRHIVPALGATAAGAAVVGLLWVGRVDRPPPNAGAAVPVQLTTWPALEVDPDVSPDGARVAFAANRFGTFEIWTCEMADPQREVQLTDDRRQNFQPAYSPDGETIAYASHGRGGIWLLPAGGGEPRRLTDVGSHPAWSPDGRWIAYQSDTTAVLSANAVHAMPPSTLWIVPSEGGEPQQVTRAGSPAGGHGAPAWTADGRRLVFTTSDRRWSHLYTVTVDGNDLVPLVTDVPVALDPVVGADGKDLYYAAVGSDERYAVWRLPLDPNTGAAAGSAVFVLSPGLAGIRHFDLSTDGSQMVHSAFTTTSNLCAIDLSPTTYDPVGEPRPLTTGSARSSRPAFSPDGRLLAFDHWRVGADQDIWILAQAGGEPQRVTTAPGADTRASWWPDGSAVVFMSEREGGGGLWLRELDSGRVRRLASHESSVDWVRLSPDGRRIAYHASRDGATNLWISEVDGSNSRQLTFDREVMGYPSWSPDGHSLTFEMKRGDDDHVMVLDLDGAEPIQLTFEPGKSWPYDFSPDGDKVAFARLRNGYWNVWWVSRSTLEQRQLTSFEDLGGYVRYPAWSPTGDRIVFERAQTTGDLWLVAELR